MDPKVLQAELRPVSARLRKDDMAEAPRGKCGSGPTKGRFEHNPFKVGGGLGSQSRSSAAVRRGHVFFLRLMGGGESYGFASSRDFLRIPSMFRSFFVFPVPTGYCAVSDTNVQYVVFLEKAFPCHRNVGAVLAP